MNDLILNGSIALALPVALLAGLVSFLSPCVLPLVPGFLGYVSGSANQKSRMVLGSILFVTGFSVVFVSLGFVTGLAGTLIYAASRPGKPIPNFYTNNEAAMADIGVDRAYLERTTLNARFLRSRYTVLDLLDETGLLAQAVTASLPSSS